MVRGKPRTDAAHDGWDLPDVFSIELEVADAEIELDGSHRWIL
jgi:hypothetical protein